MGLSREVGMLKQVFCYLILLSVVLSPVVLQLCVILIFLSKINDGLTEMASPAEQAICCLSTNISICPHGHVHRLTWLTGRHTRFMWEATQKWSSHRRPGLLGSPSPEGKFNLASWRQNQWKTAFTVFYCFACTLFWNPVITMTLTTQLGQAKVQGVVLCEWNSAGVTANRLPEPHSEGAWSSWNRESRVPRWVSGLLGDLWAGFTAGGRCLVCWLCCRGSWSQAPPLKGKLMQVLKKLSSKFLFVAVCCV